MPKDENKFVPYKELRKFVTKIRREATDYKRYSKSPGGDGTFASRNYGAYEALEHAASRLLRLIEQESATPEEIFMTGE